MHRMALVMWTQCQRVSSRFQTAGNCSKTTDTMEH